MQDLESEKTRVCSWKSGVDAYQSMRNDAPRSLVEKMSSLSVIKIVDIVFLETY